MFFAEVFASDSIIDISSDDEDDSEVPDVSDDFVSPDVSVGDESIVNATQTPKKVVEIDLTNSPMPTSSTSTNVSPVGSNNGCSVCLDSYRDIR